MKSSQALQLKHLDIMRTHYTECEATFAAVNPAADLDLFIDYNISPFTAPPDWTLEPCASHYDNVCYPYSLVELVDSSHFRVI